MKKNSQEQGKEGEEIAKLYLKRTGHNILASNWRFKKYEVDIIAEKNNTMIFVEVKARKNNTFGEPEEFVSKAKQKYLVSAAHHYLTEKNIEKESRFDIIAITGEEPNHKIVHLEDAFYPKVK